MSVDVYSGTSGYEHVNTDQRKYFKGRKGGRMPLTKKGQKIMRHMKGEYGEKKGKQVFYASQNKGTITGTHKGKKRNLPGMSMHEVVDCNEAKRHSSANMSHMYEDKKRTSSPF